LGTGITSSQLDRLKRYTKNLAISFDNDEAGERAHYKLAMESYRMGFNTFSIEIPYGKDVDECIAHDPKLWTKAISEKVPAATFLLNLASKRSDPQTLRGKQTILGYIAPILSSMSDPLTIDHHIKELHLLTDIPRAVIEEAVKSPASINTRELPDQEPKQKLPGMTYGTYLAALLLQFPSLISWASEKIPLDMLPDVPYAAIISRLLEYARTNEAFNSSEFIFSLPPETREVATDLLMRPIWSTEPTDQEITDEISSTIMYIKIESLKHELALLRKKLSLSEQQDDTRGANDLLNQINDILKDLDTLQSQK